MNFYIGTLLSFPILRLLAAFVSPPFPKFKQISFSLKLIPVLFIGYSLGKKGYNLFNLSTKVTLVSWDLIFHEPIFPFVQTISSLSSNSSLPYFHDSNPPYFVPVFNFSHTVPPTSSRIILLTILPPPPTHSKRFSQNNHLPAYL